MSASVDELRMGRNFVRVGDTVRVLPSRPGKRDGFLATLRAIVTDDAGAVRHLEVYGAPTGRPVAFHALRLERVRRVSQTRHPARGDAR